MNLQEKIRTALGQEPVDLLLKNGNLVNVLSGEIHPANVAVKDGLIVGFGDYESTNIIDVDGLYLSPGFIDGHLHLESSMLTIAELGVNIVPQGTTAVVADPHEIANVLGLQGIQYILDSSENGPLQVYVMFPSCVPATPFETSGAKLGPEDMLALKDHPRILGLAEMMNFPGVLFQDPDVLAKIEMFEGRIRDGHAPGLSGKSLCAYKLAGIGSDHECTTLDEAREKLGLGMKIMIREGSAAKNMDNLLPLVNDHNSRNCFFVTDDLEPLDILKHGHIISLVRKAVAKGLDPIRAIQMVSLNTAEYFGLKRLGAIAPGFQADILVIEDLRNLNVKQVFRSGELIAQDGKFIGKNFVKSRVGLSKSFHIDWKSVADISVPAEGDLINIIEVVPGQIVTKHIVDKPKILENKIVPDIDRDILKIVVIERHNASGSHGIGFIKGFGLKRGAIGGSVAHDSHNVLCIGTNDQDILFAAREIEKMGGGMVAVDSGKVLGKLPLPIAGLMSDASIHEVTSSLEELSQAAGLLECQLENPFATLSFMALTPIPELKITDLGLFDSQNFTFIPLFVAEGTTAFA